MNRLGKWLWWLDRDDPRFRHGVWPKLAYWLVWALGFFFLLLISQLVFNVLGHFGFMGTTGP